MGVAVLLFDPQTRGGSLGHHLVGEEEGEEWLFNAYFIGSEEEEVSSKGCV